MYILYIYMHILEPLVIYQNYVQSSFIQSNYFLFKVEF